MKQNKLELLSPAGSMDSLYAAVANGCDAVYLGGKLFSARAQAGNFSLEELEQACDYCHLRGVKVYVTVNTIYKELELPKLMEFINRLYDMGADALIIQDIGVAAFVKEHYPDFEIHASTQMTANNLEDVQFLNEQGFSKVVLSRELSISEIEFITANTDTEIETFVHGALCVSYSGQCIMSSMLGGRSGNRGRCAQTCRLPYTLYLAQDKIEEGHLLSPKDIQTITILPQLIEAGISSFKIEGRMKNPEYVAGVTQIYRKYIDRYLSNPKNYEVDSQDMKMLTQLFNRGGFTQGYYTSFAGKDMMCIERPKTWGLKTGIVDNYNKKIGRVTIRTREPLQPGDGIEVWTQKEPHAGSNISHQSKAGEVISLLMDGDISKNDVVYKTFDKQLTDAMKKTWEKDCRKQPITGKFWAKAEQPLALQLFCGASSVYVTGDVVQKAQNQPMDIEKLSKQVSKFGATPFVLSDLEMEVDENIYVGIASINALRRDAVDKLTEDILKKSKRSKAEAIYESKEADVYRTNKKVNVLVSSAEQFEVACQNKKINILYYEICSAFEIALENAIEKCHNNGIKLYAALPRIYRQGQEEIYGDFIQKLQKSDIDGFLVRSVGQLKQVKASNKSIVADYNLNIFNQLDVSFWKNAGASQFCLSPEMNLSEIKHIAQADCEMLVYGYLPVMTTQQCPVGNYHGNKTDGKFCMKKGNDDLYYLKDRKGVKFPLWTHCDQCLCTILNSKPLYTLKFYDEILQSPTGSVRLWFTKEGPRRMERILNAYLEASTDSANLSKETQLLAEEMAEKGSTKGHFFRGIE